MDEVNDITIASTLRGITRASLLSDKIVEACKHAEAGYVQWDCTAPRGVHHTMHARSLISAFNTGFSFCETDTRDEWLLLGAEALVYVRTFADFRHLPPIPCHPLVNIGKLHGADVFVIARNSKDYRIAGHDFYMGVFGEVVRVARGQIINGMSHARAMAAEQAAAAARVPEPDNDDEGGAVCEDEPYEDEEDPPKPRRPRRRIGRLLTPAEREQLMENEEEA